MTVWTVPGAVLRVVDADTIRIKLDLGWSIYTDKNCRLLGVNAPETSTEAGRDARGWATGKLPAGTAVVFVSHALDKYGRPLGRLLVGDPPADFGQALIAAGHAVPYPT